MKKKAKFLFYANTDFFAKFMYEHRSANGKNTVWQRVTFDIARIVKNNGKMC